LPAEAAARADPARPARPATQAERQGAQALAALERGREALARGAAGEAVAWLERAVRYAPDDPTPRVSLAAALLAAGEHARAADAFAVVLRTADVREAWVGLAVAALRLGDGARAAEALGHCLSTHRWHGPDAVADAVIGAPGFGHPGWCGIGADERLKFGASTDRAAIVVDIDGFQAVDTDRPLTPATRRVTVTQDGIPLLGSPLDIWAIRRVEGVVAEDDGGLAGWLWHPADPDRDPTLRVTDGIRSLRLLATDGAIAVPRPLMRPRRFSIVREELAGFGDLLTVMDLSGRPLPGSPVLRGLAQRAAVAAADRVAAAYALFPPPAPAPPLPPPRGQTKAPPPAPPADAGFIPIQAGTRGNPANAPLQPRRPVVVVIPVHRGAVETMACLAAVRETVPEGTRIVVVDDASPEPDLSRPLYTANRRRQITLLRTERNLGFPAAANVGLRAAAAADPEADLLLLNSDTLPWSGWVELLRAAVHGAPDIGTATPMSNDASIMSYPDPSAPAPAPSDRQLLRLGRRAALANPGISVDIPTAVGFCMYIRRECLAQTGVFREDLFSRGYGEENDFCLRAMHLGWRHVGVPAAYVGHVGGRSFGAERQALIQRNADILERLHPGYAAMIADWKARDPMAPARQRMDAVMWRDRAWRREKAFRVERARQGVETGPDRPVPATVLVTHDAGGGVERWVQARRAAIEAAGGVAVIIRPVPDRSGEAIALDRAYLPGMCRATASAADKEPWPVLTLSLPREIATLATLVRRLRPALIEVHHLLGHDHAIMQLPARLGVPYDVHLHDYTWFCPRVTLISTGGRYCGEPDLAGCEACVADLGSRLEEDISVRALVERSRADLGGARCVVAPSADAARRISQHFPGIRVTVSPHEDDAAFPAPRDGLPARDPSGPRRVCVVGAIGREKGYDVLLGCARDAAARGLPLRFQLAGHSIDDDRLIATGVVSITGPYAEGEAEALIRAQGADLAFIPSVWPETWCFALSEAWRAGLPVAAFDLGAPAERIRATGRGWLLPLALPPQGVNNALLTLSPLAADRRVMQTVC
jgi:GT2 family glycosyltransferase/glycosyltransferase involved in cell wall biosynthesis